MQRLSWALMILAGTVLVISLVARNRQARRTGPESRPAETRPSATRPASTRPAAAAASRPAGRTPKTPAAVASRPATQPAASVRWFDTRGAKGKHVLGSYDADKKKNTYLFQVELVNEYAALRTLKLARYFTTVEDKKRYESDPAAYAKAIRDNPEGDDGHYCLLNHVRYGNDRYLPLATRRVKLRLGDGPLVTLHPRQWRCLGTTTDEETGSQSVRFEWWAMRGKGEADARKHPVLRLVKTYTVNPKQYSLEVSLRAENRSHKALVVSLDQFGPTGVPLEDRRSDMRFAAWGRLAGDGQVEGQLEAKGKLKNIPLIGMSRKQLDKLNRDNEKTKGEKGYFDKPYAEVGRSQGGQGGQQAPVVWIGQTNKFFASLLYLRPQVEGRLQAANYKAEFYYAGAVESPESRTHVTGVMIPALSLSPAGKAGAAHTLTFDLFAGPKKRAMFTNPKADFYSPQYEKLNYSGTIHLGACFCTWAPLTFGMMWLLNTLSSTVSFGNYGVAIFLLVVVVRLVLHPLTRKGQLSMVKMQKLAPQMQKLKEKYADDKETLNKEMMRMYKEQGASPLLGCLPMMLQMPIWIALWTALNASVELRHAAFLPWWIIDLAAPDALITFGQKLPFLGESFNLLPILLTISMFLQTKLNPQMAGAGTGATPQQQQQKKMMTYMMPGMMLLFFYQAPSGLTLYIMASTTASVIEQMLIRKHIRDKEAAEAAATATVHVPGKGFRDSRPKKPKGPNWFKRPF